MGFYFYIIYSENIDRYYSGHTENLETRLMQHNMGLSEFTSVSNDWKLLYSEEFSERQKALQREKEVKRKKSRKFIEWLISSNK